MNVMLNSLHLHGHTQVSKKFQYQGRSPGLGKGSRGGEGGGGECWYHTVEELIRYAPQMLEFKDCNLIENCHTRNTGNTTK